MSKPDISLVIPVFEQPDLLSLLFASLRCQDFKGKVELLVCDDGSQADYRTLVERESHFGTNVRYIWQPHRGRGSSRSRNNGIRCARGELLIFLDGDGIVPADFLSTHAGAHSGSKVLFCGSRKQVFIEPRDVIEWQLTPIQDVIQRLENSPLLSMREWQEEIFPQAPWRICMSCNTSVLRADCITFDECLMGWGSEDAELACRLYHRHGYAISIDPLSFVYSIEIGRESEFSRVRPRSHEDIVQCLKDLLRVRALYPEVNTASLLLICKYFAIDPATNRWYQLPEDVAQQRDLEGAVEKAVTWLSESEGWQVSLAKAARLGTS